MSSKSKCHGVKNPCKICLQGVSNKTGLQCQGACRKWVHFSCLNYTPGKIKDIKTGIIRVSCPCPDCKTSFPREYRTNEPFSCTNMQCPANMPPQCDQDNCPSNQKSNQTSPCSPSPPLARCTKHSCKKNTLAISNPQQCVQTCPMGGNTSSASSHACPEKKEMECPSNHVSGGDTRGTNMCPTMSTVEQMCNTVGNLTNQINDLMMKMRQVVQETSDPGGGGGGGGGGGCNPKPAKRSCEQRGSKSLCPKPCYCPHNPRN